MTISSPYARVVLLVSVLGLTGCHKQADANAEMAKAAKALEAASPPPSPAPPVVPNAGVTAPAATPSQQPVASQPPAQQMSQAMAAYKSGDYEDAVMRLQSLRSKAAVTPQQIMAIQDAVAAVMADLYARAEKGDTKAQQAIKQWQAVRNLPR